VHAGSLPCTYFAFINSRQKVGRGFAGSCLGNPMNFWPPRIRGIAFCCISVGLEKPRSTTRLKVVYLRLKLSKDVTTDTLDINFTRWKLS
jgi:hypothetical protein